MSERPSGVGWLLYRLVRPVLRPVAWRLRTFFAGPLHDEIAALRAEIAALRLEIGALERARDQSLEPRIAAVLEQAVLTLALDRESRRD